jgi:hypothetical protein
MPFWPALAAVCMKKPIADVGDVACHTHWDGKDTNEGPKVSTWFPVHVGSYESTKPGARVPLLVWPYMNAPTRWLRSDSAPDLLIVVNDVAPENLGTRTAGSYHEALSRGWAAIESFPVQTGWHLHPDYVHVWSRLSS